MTIRRMLLTCAGLTAMLSAASWADGGWQRDSRYNKLFDPATIVTVSGTVQSITRDCHPFAGMDPGFAAMIKTSSGTTVEAQVGPTWFTTFYHHKWNILAGDQVTVTGSRVNIDGHAVIMVEQGEKGALKMAVRGKSGLPVWDLQLEDF